jgi:hypothetical protein
MLKSATVNLLTKLESALKVRNSMQKSVVCNILARYSLNHVGSVGWSFSIDRMFEEAPQVEVRNSQIW